MSIGNSEENTEKGLDEIKKEKIEERLEQQNLEIKKENKHLKKEVESLKTNSNQISSSRPKNNSEGISRRSFLKKAGLGSLGLGALMSPVSADYFIKDNSFDVQTGTGPNDLSTYFSVGESGPVNIQNTRLEMNNQAITGLGRLELPNNSTSNNNSIWVDESNKELKVKIKDTVYTAKTNTINNSVVAHGAASNYDGYQWVSDIGPNIPDAGGSPTKTSVTANSTTFDVIRYDKSTSDYSQTTSLSLSTVPQAVIVTLDWRTAGGGDIEHAFDGGTGGEFSYLNDDSSGTNGHRIISGGSDVRGGTVATGFAVFTMEVYKESNGIAIRLLRNDNTEPIVSQADGFNSLTGLTLANKATDIDSGNVDIVEYSVLEGHTQTERDKQIINHMDTVGLT